MAFRKIRLEDFGDDPNQNAALISQANSDAYRQDVGADPVGTVAKGYSSSGEFQGPSFWDSLNSANNQFKSTTGLDIGGALTDPLGQVKKLYEYGRKSNEGFRNLTTPVDNAGRAVGKFVGQVAEKVPASNLVDAINPAFYGKAAGDYMMNEQAKRIDKDYQSGRISKQQRFEMQDRLSKAFAASHPDYKKTFNDIGSGIANAPVVRDIRTLPGIQGVTTFVNQNLIKPTVDSFGDIATTHSGSESTGRYGGGLEGYGKLGRDVTNVGSAVYASNSINAISKAPNLAGAVKLVPRAAVRQFGASAGQDVVNQVAEGTKLSEIDKTRAALSGAAGATIAVGLPLAGKAAGKVIGGAVDNALAKGINARSGNANKTIGNALNLQRYATEAAPTIQSQKAFTQNLADQAAAAYRSGDMDKKQLTAFVVDAYEQEFGKVPSKTDLAGYINPIVGGSSKAKGQAIVREALANETPEGKLLKAGYKQSASSDTGWVKPNGKVAKPGEIQTIIEPKALARAESMVNAGDITENQAEVITKNLAKKNSVIVKPPEAPTVTTRIDTNPTLLTQVKQALIEKDAPLIKVLSRIESKTGKTGIVDQFMYDSGMVSQSNAVANAKISSSKQLESALKGLNKHSLDEFNMYSAARSELANAKRGLATSQPVEQLQAIVDELGGKYSKRFASMNKFYKGWSDDLHKAGIIDDATHARFNANNDYISTQRDMSDLLGFNGQGGKSFSLGSTFTSKKRVGSQRAIEPTDLTAFQYAQKAQKEIQRNQVSTNLIDVLQENNLARRVTAKEAVNKNVIKRMVNGKTEIYEVDKTIKGVVDNLNPYQLNALERIVSYPKRMFQSATTGLSLPFAAFNFLRDQGTSAINSKKIMATHNPKNIASGLWEANKDFIGVENSPLWQKFIQHSGDQTQYDLLRGVKSAKKLSREIRLGEKGKIGNAILSPIRTLEDFVSITEKATRFQNYKGVYQDALKQGLSDQEATKRAALAAWQNSVDFNRHGQWGKVINLLVPYFNSGVQGSRQLGRSFSQRPMATSMKTLATVGFPLIGVTAWNLSTPENQDIYLGKLQPDGTRKGGISEFEKENNFIVILPNSKQNEAGAYNVIKIPMPQGYKDLIMPMRRVMESFATEKPVDGVAIATDILNAVTGPINTGSPDQAWSSLVPQAIKPLVQQAANKDFFTGKDIVPDYIDQATDANGNPISEVQKAYPHTSGTAGQVGGLLGVSPIRVEKFIKDTFGTAGQYVLNSADQAQAALGTIKQDQIGGRSPIADVVRRFTEAQSDYNFNKSEGGKYFDDRKAAVSGLNQNETNAYNTLHPSKTNFLGEEIFDENKRLTAYERAGIYLQFPKVFEADRKLDQMQRAKGKPGNPLYDLPKDQLAKVLLKAALPPGAKDPELSNLYREPWYQDYNNARSAYYENVKKSMAAEGKSLPPSDNPYPESPPGLQDTMNYYSSLPKGTGARSQWINANPDAWNAMTNQWAAIDAWNNKERQSIGLAATQGNPDYPKYIAQDQGGSGGSGSGSRYAGKSGSSRTISAKQPTISISSPNVRTKLRTTSTGKKVALKPGKVVVTRGRA